MYTSYTLRGSITARMVRLSNQNLTLIALHYAVYACIKETAEYSKKVIGKNPTEEGEQNNQQTRSLMSPTANPESTMQTNDLFLSFYMHFCSGMRLLGCTALLTYQTVAVDHPWGEPMGVTSEL